MDFGVNYISENKNMVRGKHEKNVRVTTPNEQLQSRSHNSKLELSFTYAYYLELYQTLWKGCAVELIVSN